MNRLSKPFIYLSLIIISVTLLSSFSNAAIIFDDSDPAYLILQNSGIWEIAFLKTNGAIAYIKNMESGQILSVGSKNQNLWYVEFLTTAPSQAGSSNYHKDWNNRFEYEWNTQASRLIFTYSSDERVSRRLDVQVTIQPESDKWIVMNLSAINRWEDAIQFIHFPSDLSFETVKLDYILLPILPGIKLTQGFFNSGASYVAKYPGHPGHFADYMLAADEEGNLSLHSAQDGTPFIPLSIGVQKDGQRPGIYSYKHAFAVAADNMTETEIPAVILGVGVELGESVIRYRTDNGIDKYSSIEEKLGSLYETVSAAPLLKLDATKIRKKFADYPFYIYSYLPSPMIMHFVSFQPGGFDENNPDIFPPDVRWGDTLDFRFAVEEAQLRGHLVMPYSNPTWWDDESETLMYLSSYSIEDLTVLRRDGQPIYELYGTKGGYMMTSYAPFVLERVDRQMKEFTEDIPSDMLFEDQIGARSWQFDYNPSSPTPISYIQGWLDHAEKYKHLILSTELGFDKLAKTMYGFFGSTLLFERNRLLRQYFGNDNYEHYPLASMMLRDKVMLYQHDLAAETITNSSETFIWNVAFGYLFNYEVKGYWDSQDWWIHIIHEFQKFVLSKYANERLLNYEVIDRNITRSSFNTFTVITNWNAKWTYWYNGHEISPRGVYIQSQDKTLQAGNFTSYNGAPLAHGWQSFIEIRKDDEILIYHPWGDRTDIQVKMLERWSDEDNIAVFLYDKDHKAVRAIFPEMVNGYIQFRMDEKFIRSGIKYYIIKKYIRKRKKG